MSWCRSGKLVLLRIKPPWRRSRPKKYRSSFTKYVAFDHYLAWNANKTLLYICSVSYSAFFPQALRLQWEEEAKSIQSHLKTSLSESQSNLASTQTELTSTQASLTQTNKGLVEAQAALSQSESELQEAQTRLEELQTSTKEQDKKQEEELKQSWADRDAAARELLYLPILPV